MQNVGSSFSLPFQSKDWVGTFALMGLIALIPIVGWINLLGWMLALVDTYRTGRTDLPAAGFQYIGRGANLFLVLLVYGLAIVAIIIVPLLLLLGGAIAASGTNSRGAATAFSGGFAGYVGLLQLFGLVIYLFFPAVIVATERGGFAGGLNVAEVVRLASQNWKNTIIAGLLVWVAGFIGGLGIYACCIGIIFSLPYGYAVMAGVVRFYEAEFEGPPTAAAAPPPPPPPPAPTPYPPS